MKLQYLGRITGCEMAGITDLRLWTILEKGHPFHGSTRTLRGLQELGIVRG